MTALSTAAQLFLHTSLRLARSLCAHTWRYTASSTLGGRSISGSAADAPSLRRRQAGRKQRWVSRPPQVIAKGKSERRPPACLQRGLGSHLEPAGIGPLELASE